MDLYLIRHGETVDNVAGVYAGVTDSALTNYGVDQTKRLGQHFASTKVVFTHIFASPLSRAFKTAQAIQSAQLSSLKSSVEITKVQDLIEQDFGFYEKKTFQARTDARKTGKAAHRERHLNDPGFVDVESKDAMGKRADTFLDQHLLAIFADVAIKERAVVAVVSHGMLLSQLWKRLLSRLPPKSVAIDPAVAAVTGQMILQHLGGWSNTGYLELALSKTMTPEPAADKSAEQVSDDEVEGVTQATGDEAPAKVAQIVPSLKEYRLLIVAIDRKDHLIGLKRQRGGIGRSKHDEGQQKLDGFFKRPRSS